MKYFGKIQDDKDLVTKEYVDADVPTQGAISSAGLITYKNAANETLFTIQLPLYDGGTS